MLAQECSSSCKRGVGSKILVQASQEKKHETISEKQQKQKWIRIMAGVMEGLPCKAVLPQFVFLQVDGKGYRHV
jgi:hypothetical protein